MKFSYSLAVIGLLISFSSCKRCYTCTNSCVTCVLKDTADVVIDSKTLCSDSSYSTTGNIDNKASLESAGYTCDSTKPTYNKDFCTQAEGELQYLEYYNKTQFSCAKK